ncbi:MAG: zinc-dependent metalloprotease [Promicromonosporaceae bacterium]|nr:zinc-dependent metalloprotease [Promicromonosporaceae bacterium]
MNQVVDWAAATEFAARVTPPGPAASPTELAELTGSLRQAAGQALGQVLEVTEMRPAAPGAALDPSLSPSSGPALDPATNPSLLGPSPLAPSLGPVLVVDRARWAAANIQVMQAMTFPLSDLLREHHQLPGQRARLVAALEAGGVLAALAPRVLGQFDPLSDVSQASAATPGEGRLLLVAPNVLAVQRQLRVSARDFHLWVCLHEQTHALQFAAAPWLAGHLRGQVSTLLTEIAQASLDKAAAPLRERLAAGWQAVASVATGIIRLEGAKLIERVMSPQQRQRLQETTAVMSLLEGHADVMMDAVGPEVVPTVTEIRRRFERRRDAATARGLNASALLQRLLGMEAKLAQYRDGAAFVRRVEAQVGRAGLNAVWTSPQTLPSAAEISDPDAWVRRIHQ